MEGIVCKKTVLADEVKTEFDDWQWLSLFKNRDQRQAFGHLEIAKRLFNSKTRMLNEFAMMQASIIFRAVKACDDYLVKWNETVTDKDTRASIVPGIKVNSKFHTAEMYWARIEQRPSSASTKNQAMNSNAKNGKEFKIQKKDANGRVTQTIYVFKWRSFIAKGKTDSYPTSIFKNQPTWAILKGRMVENEFTLLRKEQKALSAMRKSFGLLSDYQNRQFEEIVNDRLKEWAGGQLQSILKFDLNLDADPQKIQCPMNGSNESNEQWL